MGWISTSKQFRFSRHGVAWWVAAAVCLWVVPALSQLRPMSVAEQDQRASEPTAASQRLVEMAERLGGVTPDDASTRPGPAAGVTLAPIEATPLGRAPESRSGRFNASMSGDGSASDRSAETPAWSGGSMLTTLAALGVVIALILGVRFVLAKATRTPVVSSTSAVEVLSRTAVAPRSHVLLLRVGPRVLVVGESSGGLRTLGTVDCEEQVAALLQAVESAKPQSIAGGFSSLMGKFSRQYDAEAGGGNALSGSDPLLAPPIDRFEAGLDQGEAPIDRARHGLSALTGRLRVRGSSADGAGGAS